MKSLMDIQTSQTSVKFLLQGNRVFKMDMATAGLERAKETRCESLASRRCAPDFSQSGGGRAGGLEQVGRGLGGGGCG